MPRLRITILLALLILPSLDHAEPPDPYAAERQRMVQTQMVDRGIEDPLTLKAMAAVPRHLFVDAGRRSAAYLDTPLPIGHGQTISQPYMVAFMTEIIRPHPGQKILEIGTGSGYQAAVLAACGAEVYSIEIVPPLAERSTTLLGELGYKVVTRAGDGFLAGRKPPPSTPSSSPPPPNSSRRRSSTSLKRGD